MAEGQGRDERVGELLAPMAEEFRHAPEQRDDLWGALPAQARVLERSGRVDQAKGRVDEAIEAVEHTFDDRYDENLGRAPGSATRAGT
ncbi:hypothetical protein [Streptomyces sp. NPDC101237]|uniref:hypothetical protein n=1 Tax=Streptomyces sp. NPDC101237 TaxID=3366139 RepID=UPI0037F5AA94